MELSEVDSASREPEKEASAVKRFDRDYFSRALQTCYIILMFILMVRELETWLSFGSYVDDRYEFLYTRAFTKASGVRPSWTWPTSSRSTSRLFPAPSSLPRRAPWSELSSVRPMNCEIFWGCSCYDIEKFPVGWLLDKYPERRAALTFCILTLYGTPILLITLIVSIYVFYVLAFVAGIGNGGVENAGIVGCLMIWRGRSDEGGPFMHAVHFGYSLGSFIGPLLATPFLSEEAAAETTENPEDSARPLPVAANITTVPVAEVEREQTTKLVVYLYVMLGCVIAASGIGYLLMAVQACRESRRAADADAGSEDKKEEEEQKAQKMTPAVIAFVALMCAFYFLYGGAEIVVSTFLTAFVVKSDLGGTKTEGAYATALFSGCFAATRFLSIFLAFHLKPFPTMVLSFALTVGAAVALAFFAQTELLVLQVLCSVLGIAMAPIYATGLLWIEEYVIVTNKIGAATTFAVMAGVMIFPFIAGSFVEEYPMSYIYLVLVLILSFVAAFVGALFMGKCLNKEKEQSKGEKVDS